MSHTSTLRVAMIGHGFMGAAHSQGWRVAPRFFDLPAVPELTLLVGRNAAGAGGAGDKGGGAEKSTDRRAGVERGGGVRAGCGSERGGCGGCGEQVGMVRNIHRLASSC